MTARTKTKCKCWACRVSNFLISAGVPIGVILARTDLHFTKSNAISSIAVIVGILLIVSMKDTLFKYKRIPAALVIWGILFAIAYLTRNYIDQLIVIAFFGFVAQIGCIPLQMLEGKYKREIDHEDK